MRKRNQPRGQDHYCSKLNNIDVMKIKCLINIGWHQYSSLKLIAKLWNVSYNCIYDISKNKTWKHI